MLHGFSTGFVSVKSTFKTAKGGQQISKLHFLLDKKWTPWLPIWVWVIEHPEGVFVVDTGENARVTQPDYFQQEGIVLSYINTRTFRFQVSPEQEVGAQLKALGYSQQDIHKVILTHLHLDHFDGLHYFDETDILVHDYEWQHPSFALPSLYPNWFEPKITKLQVDKQAIFSRKHYLTESKEIQLVHTPGHTKGHCSVLLQTKELDYFLAGDTTYNQAQLLQEINAGGHQSFKLAQKTYSNIKNYALQRQVVYLPSHDGDCATRIAEDAYLRV